MPPVLKTRLLTNCNQMTAQLHDSIVHDGRVHAITGAAGEGLFRLQDHGLEPVSYITSCWRGNVLGYEIDRKKRLKISWFTMGIRYRDLQKIWNGEVPELFGMPVWAYQKPGVKYRDDRLEKENGIVQGYHCTSLNGPVPFTGGLILGIGFIRDWYLHQGYQSPWKYQEVKELIFKKGRLKQSWDHSQAMADIRASLSERDLTPGEAVWDHETARRMREAFHLDYWPRRTLNPPE